MSAEIARNNMVFNQVRPHRIYHKSLISALLETPREIFLPPHLQNLAYCDENLAYYPDRCLMAPMIFAQLIEAADIHPHHRVLIVAPGTGYSLAIVSAMAKSVMGLESIAELATQAERHVTSLNLLNISVVTGPLDQGWLKGQPYDRILIEGAVNFIPHTLFNQLEEEGKMVTVLRTHKDPHVLGQGTLFVKARDHVTARPQFDAPACLLKDFAHSKSFHF